MDAWLEDERGGRFPINGNCSIGRMPGSTVALADRQVSRRHALIITHLTGEYWLVDFGSSNGTRLNGIAISEPCRLKAGDVVEISAHKLLFNARPGAARSASAAAWEETEKKHEAYHANGQGIVLIAPDGSIQAASPHAREWLATYFPRHQSTTGTLPEELSVWVSSQHGKASGPGVLHQKGMPLLLLRHGKRLRIQLADAGDGEQILLLSEEEQIAAQARLQRLGLSERESEVMLWLAEGKSNAEIGTILSLSPRTVEKHVAQIIAKLGVENRATAIIRAMELAGQ
jgi:DNA-binding CsgD family transcriptional regulator